jgi:hypothetical protein
MCSSMAILEFEMCRCVGVVAFLAVDIIDLHR